MHCSTSIAAAAILAVTSAQGTGYTSIGSDGEFIAQLDIGSASQDQVSAILNSSSYSSDAAGRAAQACSVSQVVFGDKLYTSDSSNYTELTDNNWSMTCWLQSQCILQPESTVDVSKVVLISSYLGSNFSVRSGGHNPNIGFSSIGQDGILVDLAQLNDITLSADGTIASIGPGNRWGRVYETLGDSGLSAIGGRANDIGVGGYLLGGGLSYWSSIYGMAFDMIVNYEVVLGNSSIVNANQTSNADLWWALRGGGANFGIVTRFDVETVENADIWFEGLLLESADYAQFLQVAADYAATAENDTDASATYNLGLDSGAIYLAYNKPEERPAIFDAFYDIPHSSIINSTLGKWTDLHNDVSALNPFGSLRIAISTYDIKWDVETLQDHYDRFADAAADASSRLNASMYFAPQILSKAAVAKTAAGAGSPLLLSNDTHCLLEIMITWTDAAYDQEAAQILEDVGVDIIASGESLGTALNFTYMNDAGFNQEVLKGYGSLDELSKISLAYDPYQVFQELQYAGFLIVDEL